MKKLFFLFLSLSAVVAASAQEISKTAASNATVTLSGPSASPWFHNAQASNSSFASYAVSTQSLGTGTFQQAVDGTVDTYTLTIPQNLQDRFVRAINQGQPLSILVTAPGSATAATYAGLENNKFQSKGGSEPDEKKTQLTIQEQAK